VDAPVPIELVDALLHVGDELLNGLHHTRRHVVLLEVVEHSPEYLEALYFLRRRLFSRMSFLR
jgi:hypothetical protein